MRLRVLAAASLSVLVAVPASRAFASPIVNTSGYTLSTLAANDDGSTGPVNLGFTANFFGTNQTQTYVNNNGNITFGAPLGTYTPFGLTGPLGTAIIAPFFADVDTRGTGSGLVTYGTGTYNGDAAFVVNYPNVGYFPDSTNKLDDFQLLLVSRADTGAGNFDIYFNYGSIMWDTGGASGGSNGTCTSTSGTSAAAGYSNGTGTAGTNYQLAGSLSCGAFLNGGSNALASSTNDGVTGQFEFNVRNGNVTPVGAATPEPSSLALLGTGALGLIGAARRRFARS